MSFKIIDDGTKKVVDEEGSDYKAGRSLFILTAHERKNGRATKYSINPPVELRPWREYKLPSWAVQALTAAEQAKIAADAQLANDTTLMAKVFEEKYSIDGEQLSAGLNRIATAASEHLRRKREEPALAPAALDELEKKLKA